MASQGETILVSFLHHHLLQAQRLFLTGLLRLFLFWEKKIPGLQARMRNNEILFGAIDCRLSSFRYGFFVAATV